MQRYLREQGSITEGNRIFPGVPILIGVLGIVYGDIGTSPLYAIRECFHGLHAIELLEENVMGVLSLVFWSLTMVVTLKYVGFVLKADNHGEGGIFALLSLVPKARTEISSHARSTVVLAAIFGASLLYGDGIITPAISVLSAVEGLSIATNAAEPIVLPITILILFKLFMMQRRGTTRIGAMFGPVMMLWFIMIAVLGVAAIIGNPKVFLALDPRYGIDFFQSYGVHGIVVLGSVVLCFTGGEALYADLGHFDLKTIRFSWLVIVFPSLLLNYFGQGAMLLSHPDAAVNPFYSLVPESFLYPMVVLSTLAAMIASQAMISGIFSLTRQAIQLGYLPRMRIMHTSEKAKGQIYIPGINWGLMTACIGLVIGFRESSRLAGAYGIAVTATMTFTTIIFYFVMTRKWCWSNWKAIPVVFIFLFFDVSFLGANLFKIFDGGWFSLAVGITFMIIMTTWRDGREKLARWKASQKESVESFLNRVKEEKPFRIPGTAVFMTISSVGIPGSQLYLFKHIHVLHEHIIFLTVNTLDIPKVPQEDRINIEFLGNGFYRLEIACGFMETPNVPQSILRIKQHDMPIDPERTTYYLGRETLFSTGRSRMMMWRKRLFAFISRNVQTPTVYFGLPPDRVIELGVEIEI